MEENTTTEAMEEQELNEEAQKVATPDTDNLSENSGEKQSEQEKTKKGIFQNIGKGKKQNLEEQVANLQAEKAELNDRFLRLYSDFDNYKKRVGKEKLEMLATASEKVLVSLLPIVDDFERAIAANEKVEDIEAIKEGFNLIYNKLVQMMKRFDVTEIEAKGEVFNTDFHEAVTHFPTDKEEDKGKVIDVTEKGYKLKDKVIRYAKVVVAQ